jgi:predicted transcriptional regulator
MVLRIMKVLSNKSCMGRTELAQLTGIQYARLIVHLDWLKEKNLVEYIVNDGMVSVALTELGRDFASKLLTLYDWIGTYNLYPKIAN